MLLSTMRHIFARPSITQGWKNQVCARFQSTKMDTREKYDWKLEARGLDPIQASFYFDEQLIMVDENDTILGPITKGECHAIETVKKNIYHRALSLLIFDEQDRFLLTQRSSCKITFPDYFTNACCSHPRYQQAEMEDEGTALGVRRAVIRRSHYELGTGLDEIKPEDLTFMNRLAYRAESDGGKWGEAEIDYIFILRKNIRLNLNPSEVQSCRYVTKSQMRDVILNNRKYNIKITPWVKLLAADFLFKYWDNLHSLEKIANPQEIVRYENLLPADFD